MDGSAAIHPHNLGQLMMRGVSSNGPFGHAKQCVIDAFDTNYLMSAVEVMASILHLVQNMDEEVNAPGVPDCLPLTHQPLTSLRLSRVVAVRTVDADTSNVALVVVVAYTTSAPPVAASITSCPLAQPRMTPF
jgi:hypothetical protein